MRGPGRVLIADDEELEGRLLAKILRQGGFECACVLNGLEATEALKGSKFDVLVADIVMAGNEDLELIRALPRISPGTVAVVVTGYAAAETAIAGYRLPVLDYLEKPVDGEQLRVAVQRGVVQSRVARLAARAQRRVAGSADELAAIRAAATDAVAEDATVEATMALLLRNVVGSLQDLASLPGWAWTEPAHRGGVGAEQSQRLDEVLAAVRKTIDVLRESRRSVKSRELRDLRRYLETVVGRDEERRGGGRLDN